MRLYNIFIRRGGYECFEILHNQKLHVLTTILVHYWLGPVQVYTIADKESLVTMCDVLFPWGLLKNVGAVYQV